MAAAAPCMLRVAQEQQSRGAGYRCVAMSGLLRCTSGSRRACPVRMGWMEGAKRARAGTIPLCARALLHFLRGAALRSIVLGFVPLQPVRATRPNGARGPPGCWGARAPRTTRPRRTRSRAARARARPWRWRPVWPTLRWASTTWLACGCARGYAPRARARAARPPPPHCRSRRPACPGDDAFPRPRAPLACTHKRRGRVQVHAAACGLYGFRATAAGAAAGGVVGVAGALDALALAARDPALLRRAAAALGLPGGAPALLGCRGRSPSLGRRLNAMVAAGAAVDLLHPPRAVKRGGPAPPRSAAPGAARQHVPLSACDALRAPLLCLPSSSGPGRRGAAAGAGAHSRCRGAPGAHRAGPCPVHDPRACAAGGTHAKGELVQLVLAEDVFERFAVGGGAEGGRRALAAARAAARRWAPDSVARGRVLAYLQAAVPAAAEFLVRARRARRARHACMAWVGIGPCRGFPAERGRICAPTRPCLAREAGGGVRAGVRGGS